MNRKYQFTAITATWHEVQEVPLHSKYMNISIGLDCNYLFIIIENIVIRAGSTGMRVLRLQVSITFSEISVFS